MSVLCIPRYGGGERGGRQLQEEAHVIGRVHLQLNSELLPTHTVNTHTYIGYTDLLNNSTQCQSLSKWMSWSWSAKNRLCTFSSRTNSTSTYYITGFIVI